MGKAELISNSFPVWVSLLMVGFGGAVVGLSLSVAELITIGSDAINGEQIANESLGQLVYAVALGTASYLLMREQIKIL